MCIIKNNIVQTKDSLAEDWNGKSVKFRMLKAEQMKEIESAKAVLTRKQQAKKDKASR